MNLRLNTSKGALGRHISSSRVNGEIDQFVT